MNPLLEQLHDIEGLDPISGWPLAIGWWVVIIVAALLMVLSVCYVAYRLAYLRSWKNDTNRKLYALETNLSDANARETVITLSEYIRRIAIKRFSRSECASLTGVAWLQWLSKNDPKQFDWETHGTTLIKIPYSPVETHVQANQIKDLIHAIRNWVY